jgi:hypothetical protein
MNSAIPPRASGAESRDRTANRFREGELLDLYVAVLIIVPVAALLRFL